MLVLGVDPGLARTGVAVVDGRPGHLRLVDAVCVETVPGTADAERLATLFAALETMIGARIPDVAAVEKLFFASNRRSAMRVSEARGVALCAIARHGVKVVEYTPLQVKESVAGWGGAAKPQVGRMTANLLGVEGISGPDDVADACAIAVCHHHRHVVAAMTSSRATSPSSISPALREAAARAVGRLPGTGAS